SAWPAERWPSASAMIRAVGSPAAALGLPPAFLATAAPCAQAEPASAAQTSTTHVRPLDTPMPSLGRDTADKNRRILAHQEGTVGNPCESLHTVSTRGCGTARGRRKISG